MRAEVRVRARARVKVRVRVSTCCGAARAPEAAPEAMSASSSACHPSLRTSAVMPASQSPRNSASRYWPSPKLSAPG